MSDLTIIRTESPATTTAELSTTISLEDCEVNSDNKFTNSNLRDEIATTDSKSNNDVKINVFSNPGNMTEAGLYFDTPGTTGGTNPASKVLTVENAKKSIRICEKRPKDLRLNITGVNKTNLQTLPETSSQSSDSYIERLDIEFKNLSYTVNRGIFNREKKVLLHDINGCFKSGELTAVMGPSGAGKTTLLHILSGYIYKNYTGEIIVNGRPRDLRWFKTQFAYITQDAELQGYLTVAEAMHFSANLKMEQDVPKSSKKKRIKKILKAIGMYETRHVLTANLSGGQKKRLSVALELVSNPPVLYLDEPTSGLDSLASTQCLALLKQLAEDGRTIICTIHQPSATLFGMFDHLYTVAEGKCIFSGAIKWVVPYLEELNLKCPESYNPADYLLEISNNEYGPQNDRLVAKIKNGACDLYRKNTSLATTGQIEAMKKFQKMVEAGLLTPVKAPEIGVPKAPLATITETSTLYGSVKNLDEENMQEYPDSAAKEYYVSYRDYPTSFYQQLSLLLMRTFLILWRDRSLTTIRMVLHAVMGAFVGFLYYGIGNEASHAFDNFRYIFFSIMFIMYTSFSSVILNFPLEFSIISREHFNRWYSLRAYYVGLTLADFPIQLICTFLFLTISYCLTCQPMEVVRISLFYGMTVMASMVATSIGLTVGTSFSVKNGAIFGPFFICPFLIFSGFFIQIKDASVLLHWLFHISFLKYALEGASLAIFGFGRPRMECNEIFCQFVRPGKFLKEVGMENGNYMQCFVALFAIFIILRVVAFYIMKFKLKFFR